jgi:hypothetical protein
MSKAAGLPSPITLSTVVDLLVEQKIKLDALEQVLQETNPLMHELYLGTIENMKAERAVELGRALTQSLESKPADS